MAPNRKGHGFTFGAPAIKEKKRWESIDHFSTFFFQNNYFKTSH